MTSLGRVLLSTLGFAVGFVVTTAILCVLNLVYRGIWLPVGAAALFGFLLTLLPAFRGRSRSVQSGFVFGYGAVSLWILTTAPLPVSRGAQLLPGIAPLFLLLCFFTAARLVMASRRDAGIDPRTIAWLMGLMAMGWIVAYFSSGAGGADPMIEWVQRHLGMDPRGAETLVVAVRKAVHFTFYGCVGAIAWRLAVASSLDPKRAVGFALGAALVFASFDEMRQAGIAGRTGSAWDVLIDLAGALGFASVMYWRFRQPIT